MMMRTSFLLLLFLGLGTEYGLAQDQENAVVILAQVCRGLDYVVVVVKTVTLWFSEYGWSNSHFFFVSFAYYSSDR
jgi:hypothetical protein